MEELFQIATLTIGIGGAVYTALSAIRFTYSSSMEKKREGAERFVGITNDCSQSHQQDQGKRHYEELKKQYRRWQQSFIIPVVLFNVLVVLLTCEVCLAYYTGGDANIDAWATTLKPYHFGALVFFLIVDVFCILLSFLSKKEVIRAYRELEAWAQSAGFEAQVSDADDD